MLPIRQAVASFPLSTSIPFARLINAIACSRDTVGVVFQKLSWSPASRCSIRIPTGTLVPDKTGVLPRMFGFLLMSLSLLFTALVVYSSLWTGIHLALIPDIQPCCLNSEHHRCENIVHHEDCQRGGYDRSCRRTADAFCGRISIVALENRNPGDDNAERHAFYQSVQ